MSSKTQCIVLSAIALVISFFIPFLFREKCDTALSVLGVGLTFAGTVATILTLFIAIQLYDRFGLGNKFIERKTDKVLELIDYLKGRTFKGYLSNEITYVIHPNPMHLISLLSSQAYPEGIKKEVLINSVDYSTSLKDFFALKRSYWLPNEIKEKMTFLEFAFVDKPVKDPGEYVRINFGEGEIENYVRVQPRWTFEEFINKYYELVREIENWLEKHSDIKLDLRMHEPKEK